MESLSISFGRSPIPSDGEATKSKKLKQPYKPWRLRTATMAAVEWLSRRSLPVKILVGATMAICALITLKICVKNPAHFFIAAEAIHAAGLIILVYKLTVHKSCSGLSSKTQELTALFLAARLLSGAVNILDIHSVLDFMSLVSTAWIIYMIRFKLKSTYSKSMDNFRLYYVVVPAIVLAVAIKPHAHHSYFVGVVWAFCTYVEAFSVLPQLLMMQNAKMIEPFTALYVFALGVSRFLSFGNWLIMVYRTRGLYLFLVGSGYLWFWMAFLSEIVQTFILADFCYYYVNSLVQGRLRIPV